ncbi:1-Cys peroxiredoxin [Linum perenne]
MPGLTIGDTVPNLEVESTHGVIKLHDFVSNSWTILFSHPGDFTPVCTTELGKMAAHAPEFEKRGVKLLGLSCDDVLSHVEWIKDVEAFTVRYNSHLQPGSKVTYPIISDPKREVIKQLNMVDPDEKDPSGNNVPSRALHIVGPDKKVKLSFLYPASTGRNMDEVMRVVESLQRAAKHKIATPADWKPGEAVVISPSVSNEEADKMFPQGYKTADLPSNKGYLRFTHVD